MLWTLTRLTLTALAILPSPRQLSALCAREYAKHTRNQAHDRGHVGCKPPCTAFQVVARIRSTQLLHSVKDCGYAGAEQC